MDAGRRVLLAALLAVVVACLGTTWWLVRDDPVAPARPVAVEAGLPSAILAAWDADRAAAWADGDVDALAGLYLSGSDAGPEDVRLLSSYLDRGLTVTGMQRQLLAVEVLRRDPDALTLMVTDRLVAARAVGDGVDVALPQSMPLTRMVQMVRSGGRWLVAEVR